MKEPGKRSKPELSLLISPLRLRNFMVVNEDDYAKGEFSKSALRWAY